MLAEISNFEIHAVGIRHRLGARQTNAVPQARIISLDLVTRKLRFLPGLVRHPLVALEMAVRLLFCGLKVRPDIVHCHDTPVLLVGVLLKQLFRARLVYDAHELESNKNGQSRIISYLTLWAERTSWSSIDHLISVSPSIIKWYCENLGPKPNSLILNSPYFSAPIGLDREVIKDKPRYFHETFGIPADERVFLYLGLLVPGRGVDKMLTAFSSDNVKSHLVFVGYGPLEEQIRSAAKSCQHIHLHRPVPHEEVVALSRSADFGLCVIENVSLSDYYSLPNKLFEYAFAGIPVLASRFPDIEKIVNEHGLGECCDLNMDSIVETIKRLESGSAAPMPELHALGWQNQSKRLQQAYMALIEH